MQLAFCAISVLNLLHTTVGQTCDSPSASCAQASTTPDAFAKVPRSESDGVEDSGEHVSLLQGLRGFAKEKKASLLAKLDAIESELKESASPECADSSGVSVWGTTCADSAPFCDDLHMNWADPPRTNAYACPLTCGQCRGLQSSTCKDTKEECAAWARAGECKGEQRNMMEICPKSCGRCEREETDGIHEMEQGEHMVAWAPKEGLMEGVMPGMKRPKLIMGMDVDYPPYTYLRQEPFDERTDLDEVIGVGADMIKGMAKHCGFEVSIMQAHWSDCWGNNQIGQGLLEGWYHGCMTYTHATGKRNRYLEFTNSWAKPNKPAGLIVKLVDGKPAISGDDDLNGRIIVDVTGWAPTADTLNFVVNKCTNERYKGFKIIQGDDLTLDDPSKAKGANDRALLAVLEGKADAMWIYGDQAQNYQCSHGTEEDGWNCELWSGFGKTFAYVQSGMFGWMHNGTTIAMSKKGSGVAAFLDKCFESFRQTQSYYEVCAKEHHGHSQLTTCIPNQYFYSDPHYHEWDVEHMPYMFATSEQPTGCSTGYCTCHG